jgi:hypothetical protein
LEETEFVLEAKFALEELNIFYIVELLRLDGWLPSVSGFSLHQVDVFLALLNLHPVEGSTVALDDAAVDDFVEETSA